MRSFPEIPVVAIVGRPNVGKSMLFNRLTTTRAALVSDLPGLTRDRREGIANLFGMDVRLVDTAGLEETQRDSIVDRMCKQSEQAIADADLVLFVIDARVGVTAADNGFARIASQSGKPVVLVANKAEGNKGTNGVFDAFSLGLGASIAISAEHGEGIGGLAKDILGALGLKTAPFSEKGRKEDDTSAKSEKSQERPAPAKPICVAIVGRQNAGKSTLVNSMLGEERMITGPEPGLTRDSVSSNFEWKGQKIRLFDTAGLRRKAKITETAERLSASDTIRAIRFADVVALLVDAERPFEHQDLIIGHRVTEEGRALVVAVNKWDLVAEKQKSLRELKKMVADSLAQVPNVPFVAISACSKTGLDQLMMAIAKTYAIWNRRVSTPQLNRWLAGALSHHSPPAVHGRRIKIRYVTQLSTRPPTFVAFSQRAEALPQSYVKYLTNSLRETFDLPGVPIRFLLRKGENPFDKK